MRAGALGLALAVTTVAAPAAARADGLCVGIDRDRDSLAPAEQAAVRFAILAALEREGVAVEAGDRPCPPGAGVSAYAIKLGAPVTVTLTVDGRSVTGRAANLDEVDLLVGQLVRALVTGRSLATGGGVTDRANVLRAQAAPRRAEPSARRWDPMLALGGGLLQLPAVGDRPRHRQRDIVAIEARWWGTLASERSAIELSGRIVLHDYAAIGAADRAYDRAQATADAHDEDGRLIGLVFSPFAIANYEAGLGIVRFAGDRAPRPFVRLGATASLLLRFSDPDHDADLGLGGYAGLGVQLSARVGLSIAANVSTPVVHGLLDTGYRYFLTTTALLEIRGAGPVRRPPPVITPTPAPVIRRINDGP